MSCAFKYKCKQHIAMNHVSSASQRSFKLKKSQTYNQIKMTKREGIELPYR